MLGPAGCLRPLGTAPSGPLRPPRRGSLLQSGQVFNVYIPTPADGVADDDLLHDVQVRLGVDL